MKKVYLLFTPIFLLLFSSNSFGQSAGFNTTYIVINGDFYDLQATTGNPDFQGNNFGPFCQGATTGLIFNGAEHNVYKCGGCNLESTRVYYNIHLSSSPVGSFTANNIPYLSGGANGCGGEDQQWKKINYSTNLLSGLTPGTYTIEVYSEATISCSGGTAFASNEGANYKATFTISSNTWMGNNTNWNDASNWCGGIPTGSTDVSIPAGLSNYPVLTNASATNAFSLATGATVSLNGQTLTINGAITGSGTITGSSSSNIIIGGVAGTINFTGGSRSLNNFTLNTLSSATLGTQLDVYGTVGLTSASFNINNQNLTLKSNLTNTAKVGNLAGSTLANATNVTVERYISSNNNRAYRQLTPSVNGGSFRANWQENQNNITSSSNSDSKPGFGIHITGSTAGDNGFDATVTGAASMFELNGNAWVPVASTTGINVDAKKGYLIFIRGNRAVDLNSNTSSNNTTLRATGSLLTGDQTFSGLTAGVYNFITNPFASSIDWASLYSNGNGFSANNYVYFDPNIGSRGGYNSVQPDGTNNGGYEKPSAIHIQSGQAFWAKPSGTTLIIKETDKSSVNDRNIFRNNDGTIERLQMSLYYTDAQTGRRIADGIASKFGDDYSAGIGEEDATKFSNFDEEVAILRDNQKLSIEGRPLIVNTDTLPLYMAKMKVQAYEWQFDPSDFSSGGLQAYLQDKFLNKETAINLADQTIVPFEISSDAASSATDRFRVVFRTSGVLPVNFTNVKAYEKSGNIQVEWNLGNESGISRYMIEKSVDGRNFTGAATQASRVIANTRESYNWLDVTPNNGNNFYRIKAIEQNGQYKYSQVVNVKTGKGQSVVAVYPNLVNGRVMNLQFVNQPQGKYAVQLFNNLGQQVYSSELNHLGGSANETILLGKQVSKGMYSLKVTGSGKSSVQKLIVE